MSGHQEKKPATLTRIALNEEELRVWRRCLHADRTCFQAVGAEVGPKRIDLERRLKVGARRAFEKMGED